MRKLIIKCSKCETRYHYYNFTNEIPPIGLNGENINIGPVPFGEWLCDLCAFSFRAKSPNLKSKNSVIGSFSSKTKAVQINEVPPMWLKIKNLDKERLKKFPRLAFDTFVPTTKKMQAKIQRIREKFRCVDCGKTLEKILEPITPLKLTCLGCALTLERLGRYKDQKSLHIYVYHESEPKDGYRVDNSRRFTKTKKGYRVDKTDRDTKPKTTIYEEEYFEEDTWTEDDKRRIQEEEGLSNEDMANGAWIDF
jgi:hypothetical protein